MDTIPTQDGAQGADVINIDFESVLAGSYLMRMISEGHVSADVLNIPVSLAGIGEASAQQSYQVA